MKPGFEVRFVGPCAARTGLRIIHQVWSNRGLVAGRVKAYMKFENKVVLITGGASGIGEACARHFITLGAQVSILDKVLPASRNGILVHHGDINDPLVRERAVDTTLDRFGTIDILVNNVGIGLYEPASTTPIEDDVHVFMTNVFSSIALSQLVISHMRSKRAGWIANISSVGAYVGLPWSAAYCASKAAIHSYAESLRRELRHSGIHVSTIVPGIVETRFREHVIRGIAPTNVARIRQSVTAEQVASCVVRSIAQRRRRIFIPWYGRVFAAADFFMPAVMDAYIDRQWSAVNLPPAAAHRRPHPSFSSPANTRQETDDVRVPADIS